MVQLLEMSFRDRNVVMDQSQSLDSMWILLQTLQPLHQLKDEEKQLEKTLKTFGCQNVSKFKT